MKKEGSAVADRVLLTDEFDDDPADPEHEEEGLEVVEPLDEGGVSRVRPGEQFLVELVDDSGVGEDVGDEGDCVERLEEREADSGNDAEGRRVARPIEIVVT